MEFESQLVNHPSRNVISSYAANCREGEKVRRHLGYRYLFYSPPSLVDRDGEIALIMTISLKCSAHQNRKS